MHYNRHRYYDPSLGQYIIPDPIGLEGGLRPQGYVNDPIGWIDPLGLMGWFGKTSLYRSISRSEYSDISRNGWRGNGSMEGKWFAKSARDAEKWGHTMGHGNDDKFYVVKVDLPNEVVDRSFGATNLDNIGDAKYIEVNDLNEHGSIKKVNSIRVKNDGGCNC